MAGLLAMLRTTVSHKLYGFYCNTVHGSTITVISMVGLLFVLQHANATHPIAWKRFSYFLPMEQTFTSAIL